MMQKQIAQKPVWTKSSKALMIGVGVVGIAIAGKPMIAQSVEAASNSVQEHVIARSPILDQVIYRADEAFDLQLTREQKTVIKPILAAAARRAIVIHHDKSLTPATRRTHVKAVLEATRRELTPVATIAQREKLDAAYTHLADLKLNLTPEQQAQLRPIGQAAFKQAQAVHENAALTTPQKLAKIRRIAATARTQGMKVLNHQQVQQIIGLFNSPVVTNVLTKELSLTDTQQAQVKEIVADTTRQMQAVSGDEALSAEQIQKRCYSILGVAQLQLSALLTPEQQAKLNHLSAQASMHL